MKKIIGLVFILCLFQSLSLQADDDLPALPPDALKPTSRTENLVNYNTSTMNAKINELERRITDLERDRRFQEDRLRQLDREVSELRRRF